MIVIIGLSFICFKIVELYAHGWDEYAAEQLATILDTQSLGILLLKITGRRLNIYTDESPQAYAQVASIGPLVTDYLKSLVSFTFSNLRL